MELERVRERDRGGGKSKGGGVKGRDGQGWVDKRKGRGEGGYVE